MIRMLIPLFTWLFFVISAQAYDETKLTASDGASYDFFGRSVDIDGDTAVVGAYSDDDNGPNSGSAYVYTRNGSNWVGTKLTSNPAPASGDGFGYSVAIDGDTLAVGTLYGNAVYIFVRNGSTWTLQQKLADVTTGQFGTSVDIDGDTLIAGARSFVVNGDDDGAAYIYTRSGITWTNRTRLTAPTQSLDNVSIQFGYSVAIDNGTVVVGSPNYCYSGVIYTGAAWVFTGSGSTWTREDLAALAGTDPLANDKFGWSVDVDGDTILVGAYRDDNVNGADAGCVYDFARNGSTWSLRGKIYSSDTGVGSFFGGSVSLLGDRAFIGAFADKIDGYSLGSVYEFARSGSSWSQENSFRATDVEADDQFGYSVAQTESFMIVGSYMNDNLNGLNAGAAYVYDLGYIPKAFNQFQINTYTDMAQQESAIASNSKDRYVVVWESRGQDGDWLGVYGQLYDENGLRIGDEFQINTTTVGFQYRPDVSMNADGDFVVVWKASDSSGYHDIIARLFDSTGSPLTGELLVNTYTNSVQEEPAVSMNDSGDFVVVWASDRGTYQHARSICGKKFNKYGSPMSNEIVIASNVDSDYPDVYMDSYGEFVVVWHTYNLSTNERNIFMRRYYDYTMPKANAEIVNTSSMSAASRPKVDINANGEIIVVWFLTLNNGKTSSIQFQKFNAYGSRLGGEIMLDNGLYVCFAPSLTFLDNGNIVVAWQTKEDAFGREIWANEYDSNGVALDEQFRINKYTAGDQTNSDIASIGNKYFIVWESDDQDGSDTGVFGAIGPATYIGDFDFSGEVDIADLTLLVKRWLSDEPVLDIAPDGGDGIVNLLDFAVLAEQW